MALYWRIVMLNTCYVVALVSWALVFARASLLILIDATSFSALNVTYLAPAYFLLMSGAVLSCAALLNLARPGAKFPENGRVIGPENGTGHRNGWRPSLTCALRWAIACLEPGVVLQG
jgi:hypothetical protein